MPDKVMPGEQSHVRAAVSAAGSDGALISDVVAQVASKASVSPARARHITRAVLDKGDVRTDKNFRLHMRADAEV